MKLYHFSGDKAESERFFNDSLVDYLEEAGHIIPPSALREGPELKRGAHGKPYFEDPALGGVYFSKSYSRGHGIVCFSNSEIGADCENTEARPGIEDRLESIAGRCFTEEEQALLHDGKDDPVGRFFEIWTAKEAYMKYTGRGFSEGFRSFSTPDLPEVTIETGRLDGAPHVVYSVCSAR